MLLSLQLTALAPLAFARTKPGAQFRHSLPYVPGAALFGALAQLLDEREQFKIELLRESICNNAYPAHAGDTWSHPYPATALKLKAQEHTCPFDSLVTRVCWEQMQPSALMVTTDQYQVADGCYTLQGQPNPDGLYRRGQIGERKIEQRVLTRVAISRRRGTAEDARLYSPLVLSEVTQGAPTQFLGDLALPEPLVALLSGADPCILYLGGRQSSGLGKVQARIAEAQPEGAAAISQRVSALTRRFHAQAERYAALRGSCDAWHISDGSIFTVNLLADALLFQHGWLPTNIFDAAMLYEETGIEARLIRAFTTPTLLGGWNVTWQQPKPTAVGTALGSLFVFQTPEPLTNTQCQALADLQSRGIGERRQEGYGHIRICDEFHLVDETLADPKEG
jgi:CRISPR-associated protein Csx10